MKKLKGRKKPRAFDRATFFAKKDTEDLMFKMMILRDKFPDEIERKKYISALIRGLENEPIILNK